VDGGVLVYDLDTKQEEVFSGDYLPWQWVLGGKAILMGTGLQMVPEWGIQIATDPLLLDVETGQSRPLPMFPLQPFWPQPTIWISPDGGKAIVYGGRAERPEGGLLLAVMDLEMATVIPIEDGVIGFPSDSIPAAHLTFSPDSQRVYWLDVVGGESGLITRIFTASLDGGGARFLGRLENAAQFAFSPDATGLGYLSWLAPNSQAYVTVANVDGSDAQRIASGHSPLAWRPSAHK